MKIRFFISIAALALITSACTSTFLVSKNGRAYFLGSNVNTKYAMLCETGDLGKVLSDTHLSLEMKDTIFKYNCSAERSGEKVNQLYASMTFEQRKDMKSAFRKNGFTINIMAG
jgi:hypothetical protein